MNNHDITLEQITSMGGTQDWILDYNLVTNTHVILRYDDHPNKWEIYHRDQTEDSDPDPLIISEDPNEILNFLHNN